MIPTKLRASIARLITVPRILKLLELGLLGYGTWYAAVKGKDADPLTFILVYMLLFGVSMLDLRFAKPTRANLQILLRHFYDQCYFDPKAGVRLTVHRRVSDSEYEQYVDYHPTGAKRGKKHLIQKGIVKFGFDSAKGEFTENFATVDEKMNKLIQVYNFRRTEAEQQVKDGEMSYYCRPIIEDDKVWGVLYMNAKICDTFPDQSSITSSPFSKAVDALVRQIQHEIS